jgi:choline dehydrogenase
LKAFAADYLIVGGGTAGCVLAARLSENPDINVVLIEAGGEHNDPRLAVPGGQLFIKDWSKLAWLLKTKPDLSLGDRADIWRRGKGLGGSSSINGLIWNRGLPSDYAAWEAQGAIGWGAHDFAHGFAKAESSQERGTKGPVNVEIFKSPHPMAKSLLESAKSLGIFVTPDVNLLTGEGLGLTQTNQKLGLRASTSRAYLQPARHRKNLRIITKASVSKIRFEGGRCVGIDYEHGGTPQSLNAKREVILCAGAFHSPKLLLLSGIGPKSDLKALGIDTLVDAPEVGHNLHEHPELYVEYAMKAETYSSGMSLMGMIKSGLIYGLTRSGPAASPAAHVNGYLKSHAGLDTPDLLLFAGPWGQLAADSAFRGSDNVFSISPALCQPHSRGQVYLSSANPKDQLVIEGRLLNDPRDVQTLKAGVRLVDKIARAKPFSDHSLSRIAPVCDLDDDAALETWIRDTVGICYHASSTCRMGADQGSVVDTDLKVRGVSGLRICDTSVFPFVPAGNTQAPVVALAELCAERILADLAAKAARINGSSHG